MHIKQILQKELIDEKSSDATKYTRMISRDIITIHVMALPIQHQIEFITSYLSLAQDIHRLLCIREGLQPSTEHVRGL